MNEEIKEKPEIAEKAEKTIPQKVFAFFASFGLACVLLTFLTLLTFIGTLEMQELGLYATGNKYFESIFLLQKFGPVTIPLPGTMLLLSLLFVNLLCGAIIRARKRWRAPGMLIAHSGMMFMLVSGLVSFLLTREGNLILWENEDFGAEFAPAEGGAAVAAIDPKLSASRSKLQIGDVIIGATEPGEDGEFGTKDDVVVEMADYGAEQMVAVAEQVTSGLAGEKLKLKVRRGTEEKELGIVFSGHSGNESFNLTDWSIEIGEYTGDTLPEKVMVIPPKALMPLKKKGAKRVFFSDALPFEIEISGYLHNCFPEPVGDGDLGKKAVDGFYLREMEVNPTEEGNWHGAHVRILPKGGGEAIEKSLLFGDDPGRLRIDPLTVEVDGRRWAVNLTRQRMSLPFRVRLENFTKLEHPGTTKPKEFNSSVTKLAADGTGDGETSLIEMNKPLRAEGFTVYQASWGPPDARPGEPLFTSLAVSQNPADQWPKYSIYIVAIGLTIHFVQKLLKYLIRTQRNHKRKRDSAVPAN